MTPEQSRIFEKEMRKEFRGPGRMLLIFVAGMGIVLLTFFAGWWPWWLIVAFSIGGVFAKPIWFFIMAMEKRQKYKDYLE